MNLCHSFIFFMICTTSFTLNADYEILGLGSPVIDYLHPCSEDFLKREVGEKGGSYPLNKERFIYFLALSEGHSTTQLGGSVLNTLRGLAHLGHSCAIKGRIGNDNIAEDVYEHLCNLGIQSLLIKSNIPSAQLIAFVTPDGDRTFRIFLEANALFVPEDLSKSDSENISLLHVEGYRLRNKNLVETAMKFAKDAGATISLDLGCWEIARDHKETLLHLISTYVDILFSNEREVLHLTGLPPKEANKQLAQLCNVCITCIGERGCWIAKEDYQEHIPTTPKQPLDSTGAGDLFASGFLSNYLKGKNLKECAEFGHRLGGTVINFYGADIPEKEWITILQEREELD